MALGKKPTGGERRPQVCRKQGPNSKPKGGPKKPEAREKGALPMKPTVFDLAGAEISRTRHASPRFYRSLPVPAKAAAVT